MQINVPPNTPIFPADGFGAKSNRFGITLYFGDTTAEGVNAKLAVYVSPEALRSLVAMLTGIAAKYGSAPDVPDAFKDGWEKG